MKDRILVIGSTGKTGKELVNLLVAQGQLVRAATRNPGKVSAGLPDPIEAVAFDFERGETFAPALEGVDRVFLIARPGDEHSHEVAIPFVDEARQQGVRLIVNLTAMGVEKRDNFPLRILERYIEDSGVPFVHLRPNWFMQNFNSGILLADIQRMNAFRLPAADARISFIDVRDIAAVAAVALTQPGHQGKAWTLTGAESLDHHQVAEIISRSTGRTVSYLPLSAEEARMAQAAIGWPPEMIERSAQFFHLVRQGFCAPVVADVEEVLGRRPISFEQYARDHANLWKPAP